MRFPRVRFLHRLRVTLRIMFSSEGTSPAQASAIEETDRHRALWRQDYMLTASECRTAPSAPACQFEVPLVAEKHGRLTPHVGLIRFFHTLLSDLSCPPEGGDYALKFESVLAAAADGAAVEVVARCRVDQH